MLGFNPYFTGLPILITFNVFVLIGSNMFQSLFYWITYSYIKKRREENTLKRTFQSLFYWITYSYKIIDLDL